MKADNPGAYNFLRKYGLVLAGWSVLVAASLAWNLYHEGKNTLNTAIAAARANVNKDIIFRKWVASHGGVYVPPSERTPPNPYLKLPDRDVATTTGKTLTLMNPAYALREMQGGFSDEYGTHNHITSLKPLNPGNAADAWEAGVLARFERDKREFTEVQQIGGQPYLRMMRPFIVEPDCLKCHAQQGYKPGDIRGGISTSVPMKTYLVHERERGAELALSHGAIWVIGLAGLGFFYRREYRLDFESKKLANILLERKKAQELAEESNKAKSVFLSNMSHELRTPLNAILGFSDMMRNDADISAKQRETLDIINRSGEHLLKLINDVLDMSKIEAGGIVIETDAFDLGDMVRDITDMMHLRAEEKGLRLLLDQSSDFPRFIRADAAKLRQVFINLVGNAIKFTRQGAVILRLNAQPAGELSLLNIEVEDSGSGIATGDLTRIFEPFVQVGKQAAQKGTGLGLAIARKFVELMGGRITVESTLGKGSIFRVEVPVERAAATEVKVTETETGRKRPVGLAPGQPEYRILIVEDQQENWLLLRRLLEDAGLHVRVAENGADGVEAFSVWHPHFIWMDIRMPVMDGLEAARRIRALDGGRDVRIVALTASVFEEERDNIMVAGMDDFIRKPYRAEEIFDCLMRHLGARFVYDGEAGTDSVAKPAAALRPEMLATLPQELRRELRDALVSLDAERVTELVRRIAGLNPALGDMLAHHAERLAYTAIMKALNTNNPTGKTISS